MKKVYLALFMVMVSGLGCTAPPEEEPQRGELEELSYIQGTISGFVPTPGVRGIDETISAIVYTYGQKSIEDLGVEIRITPTNEEYPPQSCTTYIDIPQPYTYKHLKCVKNFPLAHRDTQFRYDLVLHKGGESMVLDTVVYPSPGDGL